MRLSETLHMLGSNYNRFALICTERVAGARRRGDHAADAGAGAPPAGANAPSDFPADVGAILAGTASPSGATPATAVPAAKTLSGVPSSPICALDTPFGSSGSDASSALSRRWSLDRSSSSAGGSSAGGASPSPPGSWGGRAARSGRGSGVARGSASGGSGGGAAWGRRVR